MDVEKIIKTEKPIPPKSRTIIHLILVANKINEIITQALKPFGVSPQQFNVLRILRGQKGTPANLCTLNERMVSKMSNTTRLVDKLLQKGYVTRKVCKINRRKIEITITEKGMNALDQMGRAVVVAEDELVRDFSSEELKQLNLLLNLF
jgi:DNA-binding MarR family transcriptional regulator